MSLEIAWEITVVDRTEEAAVKLTHQALARLTQEPRAVFLFGSQEYDLVSMVGPLHVFLGPVPVWGMNLYRVWGQDGSPLRLLGVGILAGDAVQAEAHWYPTLEEAEATEARLDAEASDKGLLLLGMDAYTPRLPRWVHWLSGHRLPMYGAMMGGTLIMGRAQLCAGERGGMGGAALMRLDGVSWSAAWDTGWAPSGLLVEVTESRAERVYRLDGKLAAERLGDIFGRSPRQWSYPPLRYMARLYPLAVESRAGWEWFAPLEVETDGSLRMTLPLRRGRTAHVMVGSATECLQAARNAARQALERLQAPPKGALLLVDWAWAQLFWARPDEIYRAVREVLGPEVPIMGGYTAGPVAFEPTQGHFQVLDDHLLLVLLG